ncbi:hypothetical protein TNCV_3171171 [Trichonephila clavipes]|nr:hypothetical protein TNCV_3171171 [Trichonephila clavipes]
MNPQILSSDYAPHHWLPWLNKEKGNLLIYRGAIHSQEEQPKSGLTYLTQQPKSSDPLDAATKVVRTT